MNKIRMSTINIHNAKLLLILLLLGVHWMDVVAVGAIPNQPDLKGKTPLHYRVIEGDVEGVDVLLSSAEH